MEKENSRNKPRVVITGLGAITPLALNAKETWEGLVVGRSGVGRITRFDVSDLPCQIAAEVKGFDPKAIVGFKEARRMARSSVMAIAAAQEAMEDAGLPVPVADPERTGVLVGSGIGGFSQADKGLSVYRKRGYRAVGP